MRRRRMKGDPLGCPVPTSSYIIIILPSIIKILAHRRQTRQRACSRSDGSRHQNSHRENRASHNPARSSQSPLRPAISRTALAHHSTPPPTEDGDRPPRTIPKKLFSYPPKSRKAVNRLAHETAISTGYQTAIYIRPFLLVIGGGMAKQIDRGRGKSTVSRGFFPSVYSPPHGPTLSR